MRIFGGEVNATDLNTGSSVVIPNERYVEIIEVINTGNSDEIMFKGTVNEKYVSFMYNPNTMYLSNESLYSSTVM